MKNSKRTDYWFKRRRYGYGWIPVSWQGWLVVLAFVVFVLLGALSIKDVPENTFTKEVAFYLLFVFIATTALVKISYLKGPKPKWRWGKKSGDNPEEDF